MQPPTPARSGRRVAVDVAVVVVIFCLAVADIANGASDDSAERGADLLAFVLVGAGSLSMWWRRRFPVVTLSIVAGVVITAYLREYGAALAVLGLPALYAVAVYEERRRLAWYALIAISSLMLLAASVSLLDTPDGFAYLSLLSMATFVTAAIAAGVLIRNRERIFADTELRAAVAEANRLADAERAAANERSRIAREMHDVLAHSMSVIAVQAAAGREIARVDPEKAAEVFARIESVGRESLTELRRMLGVLRDTGEGNASRAPQPGIADVADIVAASTASGVATELVVEGQRRDLAPGIELAAFRIVQEALTNVRKHAGPTATASVCIRYESSSVLVEVIDDGRGAATALSASGSGHGLIGMRERVEVYGGELSYGPRPGGGYAVRVRLPTATVEAQPVTSAEQRRPG
jgi:signal transduction histidine kinase